MNSLTQRGFHGNYSSKNSSYRHYSFIRAITNHPMYDDGVCIGLLGNVGPDTVRYKCARPMPMYGVPGNMDRF